MADAFTFEWSGLKEMEKMLDQLPKAMGKSVLRRSLKKAAKPMLKMAQQSAPTGESADLAKSIKIATKLSKHQRRKHKRIKDGVEIFVGTSNPHANEIEWGTTERFHKNKKSVGKITASGFFTRSWDSTKFLAFKILTREIENDLVKTARRLSTKAGAGKLSKKASAFLR